MFKIGEFSRLSHTSIRMLRYYDQFGLLIPERIDPVSGYRFYSADQISTVNKINRLKELGFSLALIKEMLSTSEIETMTRYFELRKNELQDELSALETQRGLLKNAMEILRKDPSVMSYHVVLKEIPQMYVVSIRKIIPRYQDEGMLWQTFYEQVMGYEPKITFPHAHGKDDFACALFHDTEYKEQDVDVELQSNVLGEAYEDSGDLVFKTVPARKVASVTFNGPYEQMGVVTEQAAQWIENQGLKLAGPMFNIYKVSPAQDPNPDNWVTEACFPVA